MIRRLPSGEYRVLSEKGKNMGTYTSLKKAKNRLRQIEFFKHQKALNEYELEITKLADDNVIKIDKKDLTLSGIVRKLRNNKSVLKEFLENYKSIFDELYIHNSKDPNKIALSKAVKKLLKTHSKVIDHSIINDINDLDAVEMARDEDMVSSLNTWYSTAPFTQSTRTWPNDKIRGDYDYESDNRYNHDLKKEEDKPKGEASDIANVGQFDRPDTSSFMGPILFMSGPL